VNYNRNKKGARFLKHSVIAIWWIFGGTKWHFNPSPETVGNVLPQNALWELKCVKMRLKPGVPPRTLLKEPAAFPNRTLFIMRRE